MASVTTISRSMITQNITSDGAAKRPVAEPIDENLAPQVEDAVSAGETTAAASFLQAYHEMGYETKDPKISEADVIVQLRANIAHLEDLHARLCFMMSEISYLLKSHNKF